MSRLLPVALALPAVLAACAPKAPEATGPAPAGRTKVTVLYVADLHGQIDPHPELFWGPGGERTELAGGFARLTAAVEKIRAEEGGEVLFLDAGDTIQGSGLAALSKGEALVDPLKAMPFDGALPGNWEVAYGPQVLRERMAQLDYPVFAANIHDGASGERLFPATMLKEVHGVKVGVVGYTDPDVPLRQPPAYSEGLRYSDAAQLPGLVTELREVQGADVVLLMTHIGLSKAIALASDVPGVDAHLSADTHERTYAPIEAGGSWVVEPGAFGSFLGRLDLWVEGGAVVDRKWELIELTAAAWPDEDPGVAAAIATARAPYQARLDAVVGEVAEPLARYAVVETSLDLLLADALRDATGTEIALSNGFRFGTPLMPGPVQVDDLWGFYPIVTSLKTGKVTGKQLREFWEQELENVFALDPKARFGGWVPRPSGMTLTFVSDAPKGQRVRELKVHGEPVQDDRLYTLTACEREGDAPDTLCRIKKAQDVQTVPLNAHEAVQRYLQAHGPAKVPEGGRVVALDLPAVVRSQVFTHGEAH